MKNIKRKDERIHYAREPFRCEKCRRCFSSFLAVLKHQKIHNGGEILSVWGVWGAFNNNANLIRHQRIHSGHRLHLCTECGNGVPPSSEWLDTRESTVGRILMCIVSVEKFSLLSQHRVNIRESTVGRNLVSVSCGKTFRTSSQLYHHEYVHPRENPVLALGSFYPPFRVIIALRLFLECQLCPHSAVHVVYVELYSSLQGWNLQPSLVYLCCLFMWPKFIQSECTLSLCKTYQEVRLFSVELGC